MKIVFIRHGKPDFDIRKWVSVDGVRQALLQYRFVRIFKVLEGKIGIPEYGATAYVMASGLVRAQDSARLCLDCDFEVSDILDEADLPHPNRLITPMSWSVLLMVFRITWLLAYRSNAPGLRCDLERAEHASALLNERASRHVVVQVFGHGIMTRLIVRELVKAGWAIQTKTGSGYWSGIVMVFPFS